MKRALMNSLLLGVTLLAGSLLSGCGPVVGPVVEPAAVAVYPEPVFGPAVVAVPGPVVFERPIIEHHVHGPVYVHEGVHGLAARGVRPVPRAVQPALKPAPIHR